MQFDACGHLERCPSGTEKRSGCRVHLLEMAQRDSARRVWPVSMVRHPVPNVASSNAVQKVLNQYPWADSGLQWKGTMVFVEKPGEDRSTLFDSAKKPGVNPLSGPSSSGQDASSSTAPPAKSMPSASTKATSTGEATSPGRPASESAATGKGEGSSVPKASAPSSKAASDSGVPESARSQEKGHCIDSSGWEGTVSAPTPSTSLSQSARQRQQSQHRHQLHSQGQPQSQDQCLLLLLNQRQVQRQGRPLLLQEPRVAQRVSRR